MTKVVFLNGPPSSGKDESAIQLHEGVRYSFADDLKDRFDRAFGYTSRPLGKAKDAPMLHPFSHVIYRQGLIAFSEKFMKPLFGPDIFGHLLLDNIKLDLQVRHIPLILITDSGFALEGIPIVKHFGKENCCVVQLLRDGKDFSSDSRSYLTHKDIGADRTFRLKNNGTKADLRRALTRVLHWAEIIPQRNRKSN